MKLSDLVKAEGYSKPQIDGFFANKVDKVAGKGLSENDFTSQLKSKLENLESAHFKGTFPSLASLQAAVVTPIAGDYADINDAVLETTVRYIWDAANTSWIAQIGESTQLTATQIKAMYESVEDTNAFTDTDKQRVENAVQSGDLGTAAEQNVEFFASKAQGEKADSALQPSIPSTSTTIDFVRNKVFGTFGAPLSGEIQSNTVGAKLGVVQKIYHSDLAVPLFPDDWISIGGTGYMPESINRIYVEWTGSVCEYWVVS